MNNYLFSIIIPVYNAEKYIGQCIESIIKQRFDDWELILVDDGSEDTSGSICDDYAQSDSRIKAFHQHNSGPGAARNLGLDKAQGKWIAFVDADDWVNDTFLSDYVSAMGDHDIIFQGHIKEFADHSIIIVDDTWDSNQADIPTAIRFLWKEDNFGYTWMKIYQRDIIDNNKLRFDPSVFFREDTIFTAQYFRHVKNVSVLPVANYHYRYLDSSLQHTRLNVKEMFYVDDLIYEAFSRYFDDEDFRIFTEHWYLVNLHNGIKKSFVGENRGVFTDIERKELIEKCIKHRHKVKFSDYRYSQNHLLNYILMALWATNNVKIIINGLRWLMKYTIKQIR